MISNINTKNVNTDANQPRPPHDGYAEKIIKKIAVIFTDIIGSTRFFKSYGNLAGRKMLQQHEDIVSKAITEFGGTVVKNMGDSILAFFANPQEATKAAIRIQKEFNRYNKQKDAEHGIHVRIGIHFGDGIIETDYAGMANPEVDGVILVEEIEDPRRFGVAVLDEAGFITGFIEKPPTMEHKMAIAGINWFRSGRQLFEATDQILQQQRQTLGEYFMVDAYQVMLENGARMRTMQLKQWADAGTPEAILNTNARLLSVGYNTHDALERSFSENFTIIPPVYLPESANIEAKTGPRSDQGPDGGRGQAHVSEKVS